MNVAFAALASRSGSITKLGGSISLSWIAPTTMGDGTTVTGVTGYNVYWSTTPYDIAPPNSAPVSGAGTLTYTITGLASGNWYVWVSAVTATGESNLDPAFNDGTGNPYWTI